jgi:hypothetical protein
MSDFIQHNGSLRNPIIAYCLLTIDYFTIPHSPFTLQVKHNRLVYQFILFINLAGIDKFNAASGEVAI